MNTTHNTKTKLLAKAVRVAAAAVLSGGLALAGLGLASGIAQADSCHNDWNVDLQKYVVDCDP